MKYIKWTVGAVIVIAGGVGGYFYWRHTIEYPSTSDAYLHANVVRIAPQVSGRIKDLPVDDHQHVKQGQLLLIIDPEPFRIALARARARLQLARQQSQAAAAAVAAARAVVAQRKAELKDAEDNARRLLRLFHRHTVSRSTVDDAVAGRDAARAAVTQAEADLRKAVQEQAAAGSKASVKVAEAALKQARLNLSYTRITAPASGVLGTVNVQEGDVVDQDRALFPLVEDNSFWVDANFKETDLKRIRTGQPAVIKLDMYPDLTLHGEVDSIAPASGAAFSLLPPENATGNWVKVTQRFPVKVTITDQDPARPLRIGASAEVTVNTIRAEAGGG